MKKKGVARMFNFSDSKLVILAKEKMAYIRRDATEFMTYGVAEADVTALENTINIFSETETDVESVGAQTDVTVSKDAKAEELRVAIRGLMSRVVIKFHVGTATYRKFGIEALAQQSDSELLVMASVAVHVAADLLPVLSATGVTTAMLDAIITLRNELEDLMIALKLKIGDRDIKQEGRVEAANAIYTILVGYTNTGLAIWGTSDVAKYNDYIIYNTPSGKPDVAVPQVVS